jgi:hypothetical protein
MTRVALMMRGVQAQPLHILRCPGPGCPESGFAEGLLMRNAQPWDGVGARLQPALALSPLLP